MSLILLLLIWNLFSGRGGKKKKKKEKNQKKKEKKRTKTKQKPNQSREFMLFMLRKKIKLKIKSCGPVNMFAFDESAEIMQYQLLPSKKKQNKKLTICHRIGRNQK